MVVRDASLGRYVALRTQVICYLWITRLIVNSMVQHGKHWYENTETLADEGRYS